MASPSESEENFLVPEDDFANQIAGEAIVSDIIAEIISKGAQIIHEKYIATHIKSYAVETLSMKLIADCVLCFQHLDDSDLKNEPDDNLDLPKIDEWAAGVLSLCNPETAVIRPNNLPTRVFENPVVKAVINPIDINTTANTIKKEDVKFFSKTERRSIIDNKVNKPKKTSESALTKVFENTKRRLQQRNVTIDSDLNIIEIQEAKNLPPPLIVPHVITSKKAPLPEIIPRQSQKVAVRKYRPEKKKVIPKLIDADTPKFENEAVQQAFQTDKIVVAPGVTIRDGNSIKSKPPLPLNVMSRAQFEDYVESLKQASSF